MFQKTGCYLVILLFCVVTAYAEMPKEDTKTKKDQNVGEIQEQGGTFGEYVSGEAPGAEEESEETENELLAPMAKPVVGVIKGVGSTVEPLLEEKEIRDAKGQTKAKIKPGQGKVEVPF